jgi:TP901 family phage tail tape measure protein
LLTLAGAYKAIRFGQASIKEFASFEMGLANVATMLDKTSMSFMPKYEKQLRKLAIQFGHSTDTLSKGLYDILSASVSADKAIGVLAVASKAAIAGLTDTGTAADALTTILNSYSLSADEAAKIGDILFATVKAGKLTFGELAGSIGKVSALAAAVGLDFTEVSAAISTMTRSGIQSDIAMTALRGILSTFLSPQKEAVEVAKKYGLELNANTLQTIGLTGALEKLTGASQEEVAAIFSNRRALIGIAPLRNNLTALINDQKEALNSLGDQEEAYGKIADKTEIKLKQASEAWKDLKRSVGEALVPMVEDFTIAVQNITPGLQGVIEGIDSFVDKAIQAYYRYELTVRKIQLIFAKIDLSGALDDEALKNQVQGLERLLSALGGTIDFQERLNASADDYKNLVSDINFGNLSQAGTSAYDQLTGSMGRVKDEGKKLITQSEGAVTTFTAMDAEIAKLTKDI